MTRPGTKTVLPNMLTESYLIDPDTAAAALAMLDHWGAMDVAPMLGLVEEPARPRGRRCGGCGTCHKCRAARRWECPSCKRVMQWGSAKKHRLDVHGEQE